MRRAAIVLVMTLLVPGVAEACTVCGAADPEIADNFLASTIFLSLFPLFLIFGGAGLVWWYAGKPTFDERPDPVVR